MEKITDSSKLDDKNKLQPHDVIGLKVYITKELYPKMKYCTLAEAEEKKVSERIHEQVGTSVEDFPRYKRHMEISIYEAITGLRNNAIHKMKIAYLEHSKEGALRVVFRDLVYLFC